MEKPFFQHNVHLNLKEKEAFDYICNKFGMKEYNISDVYRRMLKAMSYLFVMSKGNPSLEKSLKIALIRAKVEKRRKGRPTITRR